MNGQFRVIAQKNSQRKLTKFVNTPKQPNMPQNTKNWHQNEALGELNNNITILITLERQCLRNTTKRPAKINHKNDPSLNDNVNLLNVELKDYLSTSR